ncbi:MAG: hypothetical protein GWP06_12540, partial [Actinobacteria bacterium]|nr:hypothetical protein [Actinomycetota bacterium]
MADKPLLRKEIPLTGKLITNEDPVIIGTNFRQLTNMRYGRTNPKGIGGHTKINTTALTNPKVRSGIHFRKEQPAESHVLVEAYNSSESASEIYTNETAIPSAGDFGSSIYTPISGAGRGRWSLAPDGYVAYANGEETCLWGGDESQIGGFINYDPADTFSKDYTDQITNTLSTGSENVATLNLVSQSTTNNMLLLHLDNNVTDNSPTTPHTITNTSVTFSSTAVFGSYAGVFNGSAYLSTPGDADFDFSDGTFCIDFRCRISSFTTNNTIFYQKTDVESVAFTLGTSEITEGDTITGKVSTETAIVDYVDITSGTWGGSDAAGTIYAHSASGAFSNEIVTVGGTDSATIAGDFSDYGDNYINFYVGTDQKVHFKIHECYGAGTDIVDITSTAILADTYYHIEIDENGDDWYIFIDGQVKAVLSDSSRAKNYIGTVQIGYDDTDYYSGYIDEYRISNIARHTKDFEVPAAAYSNAAGGTTNTYLYVGSIMPLEGVKFYISTPNTAAAIASIDYWSGSSWVTVGSFSDGTDISGVSFAQTGSMTFTSTAALAKVKSIKGVLLYWYRVEITTLDDNIEIYHVTGTTPFQEIRDIWDGLPRTPNAFYKYTTAYNDYTGNVRNDDYDSGNAATYVNLDALTTSQYILSGFGDRQTGIRFNIVGDKGNTTANTVATVSYWDGSDWASVGNITDDTSEGNISFAQSGLITWNALSDGVEFQT